MKLKGYKVEQSPPCITNVKNPLGYAFAALCCTHHHHRFAHHSTDGQV